MARKKRYGANYRVVRVKETYVPPTTYKRNGKIIHRRGYTRKAHTRHVLKKSVGRSGKRFERLARHVARQYEKKGYSKKRAEYIGKATAGKVFWRKYGKEGGKKILRRER